MKTILVPIDFSTASEKALSVAKGIAAKTGSQLTLMYVYPAYVYDIAISETIYSLPAYQQLEEDHRKQLHNHVDQLNREGFSAEAVWLAGNVEKEIIKQSKKSTIDLIVIGRTGKGTFLDKLVGSSTTSVARDAPCPVLIVPAQTTKFSFEKILYATQLEYEENDIIAQVTDLVKQLGATLTFLKVDAWTQPDIQPDGQFIDEIKAQFNVAADDIVVTKNQRVINGIEAYCDQVQADLIVVSARERGFLEEYLINPSLTKKLVLDTHLPLLVYHLKPDQ
ncbi:universal stress protein [Dyadobacter bucti]|uniref:universal stress protein n=1 Tax=Dyadobacter bucti TaxID=2572203 RepID=UPI003F709008